jgi:hypothetical protein
MDIDGQAIHSAPGISLCFFDNDLLKELQAVQYIVTEVSMLFAALFTYLSEIFARLHGNSIVFGGIKILIVGDLARLLLVICKSSIRLFGAAFSRSFCELPTDKTTISSFTDCYRRYAPTNWTTTALHCSSKNF